MKLIRVLFISDYIADREMSNITKNDNNININFHQGGHRTVYKKIEQFRDDHPGPLQILILNYVNLMIFSS